MHGRRKPSASDHFPLGAFVPARLEKLTIRPAAHSERFGAHGVLVISNIVFLRKTIQLRIAYGLLAVIALSTIAYDARVRSGRRAEISQAGRPQSREPEAPLLITPLAQSPFPEARPSSVSDGKPGVARNSS